MNDEKILSQELYLHTLNTIKKIKKPHLANRRRTVFLFETRISFLNILPSLNVLTFKLKIRLSKIHDIRTITLYIITK